MKTITFYLLALMPILIGISFFEINELQDTTCLN